jgi:hypothetical protein
MTPIDFNNWRTRLGLTQVEAGAELRVTARSIKRYEEGSRGISGPIEALTRDVERRLLKGRGSRAKSAGVDDYHDPRDIFATPQAFFDRLDAEFGFTLDVCALPENAKCPVFFTPEMNGLALDWHGVVWLNPPFFQGRIGSAHGWQKRSAKSRAVAARWSRSSIACSIPLGGMTTFFAPRKSGSSEDELPTAVEPPSSSFGTAIKAPR